MIRRSLSISGRDVVIQCSDGLQTQADFVLNLLQGAEDLRGKGFLAPEKRIQVGWSILTLKDQGDHLLVCEPDYSGKPFDELSEDLSRTLLVQARQNQVLRGFGLDGVPVSFEQPIVLAKGCLAESRLYMERLLGKPGDTGWYIGRRDGDNLELDTIRVYELLQLRPTLLQYLLLPPGYMVILNGDQVEAYVNDQDETVTPAQPN